MELFVYDLVMFRDKNTSSITLETIHTMISIKGVRICQTEHFRFDKSNLKVLQENFDYSADWYKLYNEDIEIVGIWRFNKQNKNYGAVYYEN